MRILTKLLSSLLISVILLLAIGITAYTELNSINEEFNVFKEERLTELRLIGDMKHSITKRRVALAGYMATSDTNLLKDIRVYHSEFNESLEGLKKIPGGGIYSMYDIDFGEAEAKLGQIYELESDIIGIHQKMRENEALLQKNIGCLHDIYHEIDEVIYEMKQTSSQSTANVPLDTTVQDISTYSTYSMVHMNTYLVTGHESDKEKYNTQIENLKETLTAYRDLGGDPVLYARANVILENLTTTADYVLEYYSENVILKTTEQQMLNEIIKNDINLNKIFDGLTFIVDEKLDKAVLKMSWEVNGAISRVLYFTMFMVVLNIILGIGLSINITKPIERLIEGTEKIKKGELEFRIKKKSRDEIGDLSESFNKMAEDLKANMEGIEKAKEDLEKEVETRKQAEMQVRMLTSRLEAIIRKQRHELEKKSKGRKKD